VNAALAAPVSTEFNDQAPIYRQLRDRIVAMILDGTLVEGDPAPSVRQVSVELKVNPITVSRAVQELVDEEVLEKRRGLGMFVREGARADLLKRERQRFLTEEWPGLRARLRRLGIRTDQLYDLNEQNALNDSSKLLQDPT
jgi:GntR family transcriptional regulator